MRPSRFPTRLSRALTGAALLLALAGSGGCATLGTLDAAYQRGGNGPLFMSGTRFDLAALEDRERARERFGIEGPSLPWADLPMSFVFDVIVLPATAFAALIR